MPRRQTSAPADPTEGMYRAYAMFPATRKPGALYVQATKIEVKNGADFRVQGTQPKKEKKKRRTERNVILGLLQHPNQRHAELVDVQVIDECPCLMNVGECIDGLKLGDAQRLVDPAIRIARASVGPPEDVCAGVEFQYGEEWVRDICGVCGGGCRRGKERGRG